MTLTSTARDHGGPDAQGAARWDFSTNVNAAGPCPRALHLLTRVDAERYPDPSYTALREQLAAWHGVAPRRILFAASASEFIQRITAVGLRLAPGPVAVPAPAYGDYAAAARACGRVVVHGHSACSTLRWCTEPSSPLGHDAPPPADPGVLPTVLDAAYAPLRLSGESTWPATALDAVFQLISPNKALGLPGVRGAYAIAPATTATSWPVNEWCAALDLAQPSWPLGGHAVALLTGWTETETQAWLSESLVTLRGWAIALRAGLHELGLQPQGSVTPFLCAQRPPTATDAALRTHAVKVRDATSFGLPGQMRLSAQAPAALDALLNALRRSQPSP